MKWSLYFWSRYSEKWKEAQIDYPNWRNQGLKIPLGYKHPEHLNVGERTEVMWGDDRYTTTIIRIE